MSYLRSICCAFTLLLTPVLAETSHGGFLHAGLVGEYFANTTLSGDAAFTRRDPRIDFDWGTLQEPGGSTSPGFADIGVDSFSVRWTGQLISRFTETHTFHLSGDDGARLYVKPSTGTSWTQVIDLWAEGGDGSGGYDLTSGETYDIRVEYREVSGEASVLLQWSSNNIKQQTLEPTFESSINWGSYREQTFADAFKAGRNNWNNVVLDADGWPTSDGEFVVSEILAPFSSSPIERGMMRLSFNGAADVSIFGNGSLVANSMQYDAASNTTTVLVQGESLGANVLNLRFANTSRNGQPGGPGGVTNVRFMRPLSEGATQSFADGTLFHSAFKTACSRLTSMRFQRVNDQARTWDERTPPSWPYQSVGVERPFIFNDRYEYGPHTGGSGMSHEWEIMLCNETGLDYYVTIPHMATTEGPSSYVQQLARLILYGSDANGTPYTSPTADPVYPPLNSNLRVYVEISNELWNWGSQGTYAPFWDFREIVEDLADANDPDFQIINYDSLATNLNPDGYYANNYTWVRRYWGLKLVRVSNALRAVFGDALMPHTSANPRVRPYFGWQYANLNNSAFLPLELIDNYFNNAAGNYSATPHPVSYYVYAAGGAGYFGSANRNGSVPGLLPNSGFEDPAIVGASTTPSGASWSFSGTSGITHNVVRSTMTTGETIGDLRNDFAGWVGMRFTTGAEASIVYELGRYTHAGNDRAHRMLLIRASDGQVVTWSNDVVGGTAGSYNYRRCIPVRLEANTEYWLISREEAGYDTHAGADTAVTTDPNITVLAAGTATEASNVWSFSDSAAGSFCMGPVSLRTAPATTLGNPDAREGEQCAWIQGINGTNGAIEIQFTAPADATSSTYGLGFRGVRRTQNQAGTPDQQEIRILAGSQEITYTGPSGQPQEYNPNFPWQRIFWWIGDYFFTETFTVAPGQTITLRIEGTSTAGNQMVFLDDIIITTPDALFSAGIPDNGEANGQPAGGDYVQVTRSDARWASAYGLKHMTYEHGWSIGGDSGASPVQEAAKYYDPRAAEAMRDTISIFHRAGGYNFTLGTYTTWPTYNEPVRQEGSLNSHAWPLVQGWDAEASTLPGFPNNGVFLPSQLTWQNRAIESGGVNALNLTSGDWITWDVITERAAIYHLNIITAGAGDVRVTLNGSTTIHQGTTGNILGTALSLSPGRHTLKVKALGGGVNITSAEIIQPSTLSSPILLSAADGDATILLNWSEVTGATGYRIRYGFESGKLDEFIEITPSNNHQLSGLKNGATYYFTVQALNSNGAGLPSNEIAALPFGASDTAAIAAWDFAGASNGVSTSAPYLTSARASASNLSRGPDFGASGWGPDDCFLGVSTNWGNTLADAASNGHYCEFTVTPSQGQILSVSSLDYRPGFQNFSGNTTDPRGTGIAWSVAGGNFTSPIAVLGERTGSFNNNPLFSAPLADVPELQGVTAPVTFRIYFHGQSNYEGAAIGGQGLDIALMGALKRPPLDLWRELHGLPNNGSADLLNPSGDGIPNLLKYAFNLAPNPGDILQPSAASQLTENGSSGLPRVWIEMDIIYFQFIRRRESSTPSISYTPESCNDLASWQPIIANPEIEFIDSIWERVTYEFDTNTSLPIFFRVSVGVTEQ